MVKAPAEFRDAEQEVHQGTAGEENVAHQEIFAVQHVPVSDEMDTGEDIVPQDAGDGKEEYRHQVDEYRFPAAPAEVIHGAGNEVFKDRSYRGERGEGHEDEEQGTPETAGSHVGENLRQGNEDQGRSLVRMHVVGKAGRENDESRQEGHEGIQRRNTDSLAGEGEVIGHVAAENFKGCNPQGQCEEGLVHSCRCHIADARFHGPVPVREEVEFQSRFSSFQEKAVERQHHDKDKEAGHHDLRNPFHPVMEAQSADQETENHGEGHEDAHFPGVPQHGGKYAGNGILGDTLERAGQEFPEIPQHPAGDGGVVHHEEIAAGDAEPAMDMPVAAGLFQCLIGLHRTLAAAPAYGQFHGHDGNPHEEKEAEIKQYKYGAPVFAGNVGKFPYITYADGTSCTDEQEPQAGFETVAVFH